MQVGFIGLRSPIAANRLAAGHDLTVYNRTKAKAEHLVKRGAQLAKTPGDADRFLALIASRGGDLDWSALALLAKRDAGGETPLRQSE
jgi:3-hydroxyisobutyrate dehydrogenase-like beta-hydroxyacid dehydrogenase